MNPTLAAYINARLAAYWLNQALEYRNKQERDLMRRAALNFRTCVEPQEYRRLFTLRNTTTPSFTTTHDGNANP